MSKEPAGTTRRKPAQRRSRERVELILRATGEVILEKGVAGLTPTSLAQQASIPTSTIYQYFDNTDDVLSSYIDQEFEQMAVAIAQAVMGLEVISLRSLFGTASQTHLEHFQSHPEMVPLWIEGRLNAVVAARVSMYSGRLARFMDSASRRAELIKPDTPTWAAELAIRGFDRTFEVIFAKQRSSAEQQAMTDEFLDMVATYAEINYATERGRLGIPASEFIALLGGEEAAEPADFWAGVPRATAAESG